MTSKELMMRVACRRRYTESETCIYIIASCWVFWWGIRTLQLTFWNRAHAFALFLKALYAVKSTRTGPTKIDKDQDKTSKDKYKKHGL